MPLFCLNMDSTLNFRNSDRKITDNREIRAVRFNLRPKSKKKIQRKEGRSWQGHSTEHLLSGTVSPRLLVSRPEPLQFQSKWQCFSEGSSSNPTTKNWTYKSLDVLAKNGGPKPLLNKAHFSVLGRLPWALHAFFQGPGCIRPVSSLLSCHHLL